MPQRLLIRNGLVIDPAQNLESVRDVLLHNGKVSAIAKNLARRYPNVPVLEARGCWVVPGLIDMHVHLRQPGSEEAETIASGTRAAAAGGFSTILAMPNTKPPLDRPERIGWVRAKAQKEASINVLCSGCATIGQKGERMADLRAMKKAGMKAVTEDGRPLENAGLMRRVLELLRGLNLPFISHCEDLSLSDAAPLHEGNLSRRLGLAGASWAAETVMVLRDIALCELTGAHVHIAHVSARQSVEAVRSAKRRGLRVSAEVTPHHLALCEDDIPGHDADFKMNPPLRSRADRAALQAGLCDGTIDAVATDHAPHTPSAKSLGLKRAPFGVIGLETALAVVLATLVHPGRLGRRQMVERMSRGPARILGLKRKGSLKPGMDADVTVIAPWQTWVVPRSFLSRGRNCPFAGKRLRGRVRFTLARGQVAHAL
ncbi:MAG TPA: dihydroorotase [Elusimicrobia bacterium]|nr:dihydroorotase [Elusimicrobiota bacterium]HBT60613.1 dihydroorotase [Elusimicrobiota bacterium]